MSEERILYESESRRTVSEVIDFLQQLAGWLGDRQLAFDDGEETVMIAIPNDVVLGIEVEEEDEEDGQVKCSLEIEIEWIEARARSSTAASTSEAESALKSAAAIVEEEE